MKKLFKLFGIIVIILLILVLVLPFVFKGTLTDLARQEANKNLKAKVEFKDINLSLIKSFPNFNLGIEDLTVVGIDDFSGDTLAYIPSLGITVDLFSVIKGTTYTINKIEIQSPAIFLKVLENGIANYDIAVDSGGEAVSQTEESTGGDEFQLSLKKLIISNAILVYEDAGSNMSTQIVGMDFRLSGDLSADQTTLKTTTEIDQFNLKSDGIPYFRNANVSYKADIHADLKNEIYTLKKNSLLINELLLAFDGSVSMVQEDINLVLTFNTPKTEFKHLLSLIPAIYKKDFASLQTSGKLGIDGHVKGIYNEKTLPAFSLNIDVSEGTFQYPDLPAAVTDVNIQTKVSSKGGSADNTVIDISRFHLKMGQNPVDLAFNIKTPVSDPEIKGKIKGKMDLSTVQNFYPLDAGEEMKGLIIADVTLQGKLSALENEAYDSFTAIGSALLQNFAYTSTYTKDPVVITNAQLNFSPQYLDLVDLKCSIGKNDIQAGGKIDNYLAYTLGDETLTGTFTTRSSYMNLNELMLEEEGEASSTAEPGDTTGMGIIEVPGKIDFNMNSSFQTLIYDNMEMTNVNGKIAIRDNQLLLNNLSMNILEGEMVVSGRYSTVDPQIPEVDFDLDMRDLDIQQAYNTFGIMEKYAPIAKKATGKFSTNLKLQSILDQEMSPVYESMTGGGQLQTTTLGITNVNTLNKIADVLKYESIKELMIEKILIMFEFVDGKILIEPFDIKNQNFTGQMTGWTALDQSIGYTMNLNIPRNSFGESANNVLENLVSQANEQGANFSLGETVPIDVLIGGTLTNPEIKTKLKETGKDLVEDAKKKVKEEIEKQKEELTQQAKAEAQKIINEANKQANALIGEAEKQATIIRKNAADAAKTVRDEGEKQAKAVEAEGKKNGFLAEVAAKETAKQMRKEANKQAKNLEDEADKQASKIVNTAKQEAAKLRQNAQNESDKILKGN